MNSILLLLHFHLYLLVNDIHASSTINRDIIDSQSQLQHNSNITVHHALYRKSFFAKSPFTNRFTCRSTKAMSRFTWMYFWNNGLYTVINVTGQLAQNDMRKDSVRFGFPNINITHVVCVTEDYAGNSFSGRYDVHVNEPTKPVILNEPMQNPIWFTKDLKIKCIATGNPLDFVWFKDGNLMESRNEVQILGEISTSELAINPTLDDARNATYTCAAENFLGMAKYDFPVAFHHSFGQNLQASGHGMATQENLIMTSLLIK